jgi:hypothetical protein
VGGSIFTRHFLSEGGAWAAARTMFLGTVEYPNDVAFLTNSDGQLVENRLGLNGSVDY